MGIEYSGLPADRFLTVADARDKYELTTRDSLFASEIDRQLIETGVGKIVMPVSISDFQQLLSRFETCINEVPHLLEQTKHKVDMRFGNEAGFERKKQKVDRTTGLQSQDAKSLMHFNENARRRWQEEFSNAPAEFTKFMADGYEIHNGLVNVAKQQMIELEETHPNISRAHFPGNTGTLNASCSFMRLLRYDRYRVEADMGAVAKPHYDIGGMTIQGYADAPGFWGAHGGREGERIYYDTLDNEAYIFMGKGYSKLYGDSARIRPLYHGVDRIIPEAIDVVPERHAVILFIDAPLINYGVKAIDTLPYLSNKDEAVENDYIQLGNTA